MLKLATSALASVLAALALVAASPAAAHSPAGGTTKCGDGIVNGSGWYRLKATDVSCGAARKLAGHYVFEAGGNDDGFRGWSCAEIQVADEIYKVHCLRQKDERTQKVRFLYGA
jgi:hypothetical protein